MIRYTFIGNVDGEDRHMTLDLDGKLREGDYEVCTVIDDAGRAGLRRVQCVVILSHKEL